MTTRTQTDAHLSEDSLHHIERVMKQAVRAGIREALTDQEAIERFWDTAFRSMQSKASKKTGRFVLGSVATAGKRAAWIAALFALVYSVGGVAAVSKLWHSIWNQP